MNPILAGTETEYGLLVEGFGADQQVENAQALVRSYPGECFVGWDYRFESPRADLRGFSLERLAFDPTDAQFDKGKQYGSSEDIRSDRILPNGARFYNDHGHPEYSTPESFSIFELARLDQAGQAVALDAMRSYQSKIDRPVRMFKNNTDFHKASYGTHESYLVARSFGFQKLFDAVTPMLVVRQILTGAGKAGYEHGDRCNFQISQRADFFVESANAETLYRRPVFNTRDEPHAEPSDWIRLHMISCDANMNPRCTALRVGLVKLALHLLASGEAPIWKLRSPVKSFESISKDDKFEFRIDLEGQNWTTAYDVLESYLAAGEAQLDLDVEMQWVIEESRFLMTALRSGDPIFRTRVDWAAKKFLLDQVVEGGGAKWGDSDLASYDLEFSDIDPEVSLYEALRSMEEVDEDLPEAIDPPLTRAYARGIAVQDFRAMLKTAAWRGLTFRTGGEDVFVDLPPNATYPKALADVPDVETFINMLRGVK